MLEGMRRPARYVMSCSSMCPARVRAATPRRDVEHPARPLSSHALHLRCAARPPRSRPSPARAATVGEARSWPPRAHSTSRVGPRACRVSGGTFAKQGEAHTTLPPITASLRRWGCRPCARRRSRIRRSCRSVSGGDPEKLFASRGVRRCPGTARSICTSAGFSIGVGSRLRYFANCG